MMLALSPSSCTLSTTQLSASLLTAISCSLLAFLTPQPRARAMPGAAFPALFRGPGLNRPAVTAASHLRCHSGLQEGHTWTHPRVGCLFLSATWSHTYRLHWPSPMLLPPPTQYMGGWVGRCVIRCFICCQKTPSVHWRLLRHHKHTCSLCRSSHLKGALSRVCLPAPARLQMYAIYC
jgi:hypothetical protein